jgi:hypothetical protein
MSHSTNKLFAKLGHGFADDPKIIGLSDKAFRVYVESLLYACSNMTDGFLDERVLRRYGWLDAADELIANDANSSWLKVDGGYQIHAFCDWKMTSEAHARQVTNGRAGGLAKAKNRQEASQVVAGASEVLDETASKVLPDKDIDKDKDKDLKPLSADSRKTQLRADWKPSDTILSTVADKYPLVDITYESERFINYWMSTGTPMKDWGRTWQNWMLRKQKELSEKQPAAHLHHPPEDDWMYKDVKWGDARFENAGDDR